MKIKKWELPDTTIFWDEYDKHYLETGGESYNKTFRISKMLLSIDIITNDSDGLICLSSIKHIDSKKELFKIVDFISRLNKIDRFNICLELVNHISDDFDKFRLINYCIKELIKHQIHIVEYGTDIESVENWKWSN